MKIIDRLDKYMELKGINDNQITVNCSLSIGLLGKARKGKSDIGKKAMFKILTFYQDLNKVWLMTGEGNMLNDEEMLSASTNVVSVPAEAWNVIKKQADSLASKDRQVEELITLLKKENAPKESDAECADVG